jgi:hypothetical protein
MIAYQDFAPQVLEKARFLKGATYESLDEALAAANAWIQEHAVKVLNVETVVLPNIYGPGQEGTADPELPTVSGQGYWHQFIRVWFEA